MIHKKTKQSSFIIYPLNLNESLKTTGRNTYARVPSRKSSTPPDWDFQTPSPPLSKHSNKKSVTENAMLLAATNKQ
jgi:hypothetical protein